MKDKLHGFSHITGGGIAENTSRVIPNGLCAIYRRETWSLPVEMQFLSSIGDLDLHDMERAWNCGIGMTAIVDVESADLAIKSLAARGMKAWICGEVQKTNDPAIKSVLTGKYRG
jgi:phosphoribosylformylglycinamidine cyclo-ligase